MEHTSQKRHFCMASVDALDKIYTLASPFHPSDRHLDVQKWLEFVQECSRTAAFGASLMWQPCSVWLIVDVFN